MQCENVGQIVGLAPVGEWFLLIGLILFVGIFALPIYDAIKRK